MCDNPLTPREFKVLLDPLLSPLGAQGQGPIAVAVSGGGDSMALLRLAHDAYPGRIAAFTVDHGLRSASRAEAVQVGAWCASIGASHRVLRWAGEKPKTAVQARAREARYALLAQSCAELGRDGLAAPLVTAHTLEDQSETFLLRLAHGSDLGGLGAMRVASELAGAPPVPLLRPLLGTSRASLRATLKSLAQDWIDDPSNENPIFERVRLRRVMPALAEGGLGPQILDRASAVFARIDAGLVAAGEAAHLSTISPDGSVRLNAEGLCHLPAPVALRLLSRLLRIVGGEAYPPGRGGLIRLLTCLGDPLARGATLAGCRLKRTGAGWLIGRELRAASRSRIAGRPGEAALWDRRFWVRIPAHWRGAAEIRPLGAVSRTEALWLADLPALARAGLPGLYQRDRLIEIPRIALDGDGWAGMRGAPSALFVGEARVAGTLCQLWRKSAHAMVEMDG